MSVFSRRAVCMLAALLLFLSLTPAPVCAAPADPNSIGIGYSAVLYNNTNGLPTSDVNAVVQSGEGFLWIGSYSGLIRYDGNEFYRYSAATGMSSVVSLCVDSRNRLWIGTNDSGVFLLEGDVFRNYDRAEGLRSSTVRSILEDADGNILIATTKGMAYVDPDGEMHPLNEPMINSEYIWELAAGPGGVVYGLTQNGLLFTLKGLRVTGSYHTEAMGVGTVNTVYPDPEHEGFLYLGTQEATVVYGELNKGMQGGSVVSVAPQKNVRCLRLFDGMLWVCANNGIGYILDGAYVPLSGIPMNNSVEHVIRDFESSLWFTSSRQGLMKIVPTRFTDISRRAELDPMVVNTTFLQDGLLYIGADTGLTILDYDYSPVDNELTGRLAGARIRSIHEDRAGRLWFGTNGENGIVRYDPADGSIFSFNESNGLVSNWARTVFELSDGRMAAASDKGVNILEGDRVTALYGAEQGLENPAILCLEEGPNGEIYAGSDGDGIYSIDGGKIRRIGREDGLRSDVILRMRRDRLDPELYWIITSNSIAWMKNSEIHVVHGFPYSNNFDLFFDDDARMWVLSSNGIYIVKREDMLRDGEIDYTLYDTKTGLPCAATANSYSYLAEDGTLFIAASTGVSAVNINEDSDENVKVRLVIPFLRADDEFIPVEGDEVRIGSGHRRLTIYPYAFSYLFNNPHLSYRLEGLDDKSTELTQHELTPLTYTNLRGGTYRFILSQLNTMTGLEDQTLTLTLNIEKTIYEQVWFWILLAVLGAGFTAGSVVLYYRRKTKILLDKQREHKLLIDEMANTFANCIDMKDSYTNGHSHRVAKYTTMLAKRLGKSGEELEDIQRIALLHDIGKIGIPDNILNKPGKLTDEEFVVMKSHSQRGYDILKEISIAPELAIGAGYHHERLDGRGYPRGLKKEEIPEIAQIIAVADTFDAMYSTRPYRKRLELDFIASELKRCMGTQLNEDAVKALLQMIDEGVFTNEDRPD